jgi:hypothetical protein
MSSLPLEPETVRTCDVENRKKFVEVHEGPLQIQLAIVAKNG